MVSNSVPWNVEIQIAGVIPVSLADGRQKSPEIMPPASKHRPHKTDSRIRRRPARPTHSSQTFSACAAEQSHQEQLNLIVPVVTQANGIQAVAARDFRQEPMPKPSGKHFQALSTPLALPGDLEPFRNQLDPQPAAQVPDKSLVPVGFLPTQSVVHVRNQVLGPESPRLPRQRVQKCNRISPRGHGDQQSATGRYSAAVHQGSSNGSGQGIQAHTR
jgi:hypothetical protein